MSDLRCAACGFERKEHSYNGACYGVCGEFQAMSEQGELIDWLKNYGRAHSFEPAGERLIEAADEIASLRAQLADSEERFDDVWKHGLQLEAKLARARKALWNIASLEAGSRGAYNKFSIAQSIAKQALTDEAGNE